MEQKIRVRGTKPRLRDDKRIFSRKAPHDAVFSGGIMLVPPGATAAMRPQGNSQEGDKMIHPAREGVRVQIENLKSPDVRASVAAADALIKAGGKAVPHLARLLEDRNAPAFKRALFVLHNLHWVDIDKERKEHALEKLTPVLFTFSKDGGRSPSSLISQDIILKMGQDALPYLAILLRSELPAARLLGLTALIEVDWKRMPYMNVAAVESALETLRNETVDVFRQAAGLLLKRIRGAYTLVNDDGPGLWGNGGGNDVHKAG